MDISNRYKEDNLPLNLESSIYDDDFFEEEIILNRNPVTKELFNNNIKYKSKRLHLIFIFINVLIDELDILIKSEELFLLKNIKKVYSNIYLKYNFLVDYLKICILWIQNNHKYIYDALLKNKIIYIKN
jgi:hypothetical protein